MNKITLLFLLAGIHLSAQNDQYALSYEVTRPDIERNHYAKDSTANALIIYKKGHSFVDKNSFDLNTTIKCKLKILNRKGFNHAEVTIPLYDDGKGQRERIKAINATVYNIENGKVVKTTLKKTNIFEEKYNDNYTLVKFAFPSIKEGSVVNYSYVIESPFMYKFKGWDFQTVIPTLHSEYIASIPGNWEYNVKLVGGKKLSTNTMRVEKRCLTAGNASANCSVSNYIMLDVPAFIEEDYMTTKKNYLARIEYELKTFRGFNGSVNNITKNWKSTDDEIRKETDLGKELNQQNKVRNLLPDAISQLDNPLEKAKSILRFVQDNYNWNEEFNLFRNVSIKELLKDKTGSAGDINILLYLLLKEHNIDVKPMILSTRNNGLATQLYPVLSDFNYLIAKATINGETYLLDGTNDYLAFGQLPFRCLNQYGRILDFENGSSWYDFEVKTPSLKAYNYEFDLNENGVLNGHTAYKTTGYHALYSKEAYLSNPTAYTERFENQYSTLNISELEIGDIVKSEADFTADFNMETTPDRVGNTLYINPFLIKFFSENPFKLQERSYPIDFGYKDVYIHSIKINVDPTYKITELPKAANLKLPENKGALLFSAQQNENTIMLFFKLSFNEPLYEPVFYDGLKTIMSKVVDIQNNSLIVLEKKE
ncbi:DUF3857 domain-containing protein [Psychroserpens sp. SPM9]|uniref:DUF3857 domain-containing protein n=1 Tax=Psychroserpens sp. SPM9 TaxID=2975598 RepID=UPI0021A290B5|nr:DUF3857 domain-containing protein [Psychroserpens sp. SPM9]MDG5491726.1 DUF3857 domain-containing protein [Psychroserpens sp. SPM9]